MKSWITKIVIGVLAAGVVLATATAQSRVTLPELPPAAGEECVEPTDVMRRDHPKFLLHIRDETVHGGIRGARHSLVECIDCHVQPVGGNEPPRYSDPQHFCASCHVFTGVRVDCFQCHADRPARATYFHKLSGHRHHMGDGTLSAAELKLLAEQGESHE
ncbi:hypothetical protein HUS23_09515 [Ectothiorhodospiraceae bacterium 2226]|nr:hypothetical protein HUS23_09515 [Ectothiorhodospiraceae bacterium 2226]